MLTNVDMIPARERQLLLVFKWAMDNSHELTPLQKTRIEDRLQQVVQIWTNKEDRA